MCGRPISAADLLGIIFTVSIMSLALCGKTMLLLTCDLIPGCSANACSPSVNTLQYASTCPLLTIVILSTDTGSVSKAAG
jgi:hypothetical protein